jgi:hypothetical protein
MSALAPVQSIIARCSFLQHLEGLWRLGMTMLRDNKDNGAERQLSSHNVLGEPPEICSMRAATIFRPRYRNLVFRA